MIFFAHGSASQRADRVLDLLTLFNAADACALHTERGIAAMDPDMATVHMQHASLLNRLLVDADTQSLSRSFRLSAELRSNAETLEEAYAVLTAAIRDGVRYEDAAPDWRRPFMDMLPRDGSYRSAEPSAENTPLAVPSTHRSLDIGSGMRLIATGDRHWITHNDVVVCGPGKTSLRITPAAFRGRNAGSLHCAAERLLNVGDPKTQSSLTIGGYKSRSRAWDILAQEAQDLGIEIAHKGAVPDFSQLETVLNDQDDLGVLSF